jgi:hypothetical protein
MPVLLNDLMYSKASSQSILHYPKMMFSSNCAT